MSRWIDADALEYDTEWSEYHDGFISYSQLEIDTAPSIDIVRCKECTERDDDWCMYFGKMINPDDFCSYGERNSSEKPNNCEDEPQTDCKKCKWFQTYGKCVFGYCYYKYEQAHEPQTETEIARAIVHKIIDNAVIAEDAYPDLRQKMHDAVDEYEPRTERSE